MCAQIFFNRDYATDRLVRSKEINEFYEACP
ncbi:MAG: hypothetical protein QOC89_304, partial [Paraburkholderia sp.]|nr:hypothetical protein [Paraburkholderia sp.]